MKRQAGLLDLSREHHAALVWAARARRGDDDAGLLAAFPVFWQSLLVHFAAEEQRLPGHVPPAGLDAMREDHARLVELARRIEAGDVAALSAFGERLGAHVRFEERQLFPAWSES